MLFVQLQKLLRLRGKGLTDEELRELGGELRDDEEGVGPRSNVSLLDQHQHLKEKAEGGTLPTHSPGHTPDLQHSHQTRLTDQRLGLNIQWTYGLWMSLCLCARVPCSTKGVGKGETAEGGGEDLGERS